MIDIETKLAKLEGLHQDNLSLSGTVGQESEEKDPLAGRIGHLGAGAQAAIREMSDIQHKYPIRAYETEDFYAAGIICSPGMREEYPGMVKKFSGLFFGEHHVDICQMFGAELQAVARQYGKTSGE